MKFIGTPLSGAFLIETGQFHDDRGIFRKVFHAGVFRDAGLEFEPREEFFSISRRDVLRGMHFQLPPHDHAKVVSCARGRILDVIVDLRLNSSTYRQSFARELTGSEGFAIFVPSGFAHGFLALEGESLTFYSVSSTHIKEADTGIHWDSFGFAWPCKRPIVSPRDQAFPPLDKFHSPFVLP